MVEVRNSNDHGSHGDCSEFERVCGSKEQEILVAPEVSKKLSDAAEEKTEEQA